MSRDLSFLEPAEDDDEHIRALKAQMQIEMAMPELERKHFIQEQRVAEEQYRLDWMVHSNKQDDDRVQWFSHMAREYVTRYEEDEDDKHLVAAEQYTEMAKLTKEMRFTIGDIRKQRERVQWQRRKLNQMTKPNTGQGQSSEASKT